MFHGESTSLREIPRIFRVCCSGGTPLFCLLAIGIDVVFWLRWRKIMPNSCGRDFSLERLSSGG
jgi:hypothetical protein